MGKIVSADFFPFSTVFFFFCSCLPAVGNAFPFSWNYPKKKKKEELFLKLFLGKNTSQRKSFLQIPFRQSVHKRYSYFSTKGSYFFTETEFHVLGKLVKQALGPLNSSHQSQPKSTQRGKNANAFLLFFLMTGKSSRVLLPVTRRQHHHHPWPNIFSFLSLIFKIKWDASSLLGNEKNPIIQTLMLLLIFTWKSHLQHHHHQQLQLQMLLSQLSPAQSKLWGGDSTSPATPGSSTARGLLGLA